MINQFNVRQINPSKLFALALALTATLAPATFNLSVQADDISNRIVKLTDAITKNPSSSELGKWYAMRGASYFLTKEYTKAEADLKTAIAKDYETADVNVILSTLSRLKGNKTEAKTYIERALTLRPDARSYVARAEFYYSYKDYALSLADAEKAFSLDPNQRFVKRYLGLNQCELTQYPEAIENLDNAIAETPNDALLYLVRGVAHLKLRHDDQALADFDALLKLEPNNGTGQNNRGLTLAAMKRYDEALDQFNRSIKYFQESKQAGLLPKAYYFRSMVYFNMGDYEKAQDDIQVSLKSDPKNTTFQQWKEKIETQKKASKS